MKKQSIPKTGTQAKFTPCYYMPKNFLIDGALSKYSLDSKLLVGIMLSVASEGKSMVEAATMIKDLGEDYLNKTINELKQEVGE